MQLLLCKHERDVGSVIELIPTKILGIGTNYRAHAEEMGKAIPAEPLVFMKPPSSLLATDEAICRPGGFDRVDYEGELGVVMGKRARHVSARQALDYVMGYLCVNDVTVRDLQKRDVQFTRAKGFDTFCPVGPRIVSSLDPTDLRIVTRVNGETRQDSRTSDLIFSVQEIIAVVSAVMTLEVGDIITTGTPSGVGNLNPGDQVEVEVEGIGVLRNSVVAAAV